MQAPEPRFDAATLDIATPEHYERHGYPHPEWAWIRRHDPVFWYDRPNVDPFWAITKHADIIEISKQPQRFLNAPRLAVFTNDLSPPEEGTSRHLLNMDPQTTRATRNSPGRTGRSRGTVKATRGPVMRTRLATLAALALTLAPCPPAPAQSDVEPPAASDRAQIDVLQQRMTADPATMDTLRALQDDPAFQDILDDPDIAAALESGNTTALMTNPKVSALVNHPKVREITDTLGP